MERTAESDRMGISMKKDPDSPMVAGDGVKVACQGGRGNLFCVVSGEPCLFARMHLTSMTIEPADLRFTLMPASPSDHLFHLVKSLSRSEWSTLWRFKEADAFNPRKQSISKVFELINLLAEMEAYNDGKLKEGLGENGQSLSVQQFKDLKRYAEDKVIEAIEYAPENQSLGYTLDRLPNLLDHLLERGILFRVRQLLKKYLPKAKAIEAFGALERLVEYQEELIKREVYGEKRKQDLERIQEQREEAQNAQKQLFILNDLRENLRNLVTEKSPHFEAHLEEINDHWKQQSTNLLSQKAEILAGDIRIHIALHRRDWTAYEEGLRNLQAFSQSNALFHFPNRFFRILISAQFNLLNLSISNSNFTQVAQLVQRATEQAQQLSNYRQQFVECQLILSKVLWFRKAGMEQELSAVLRKGQQWYQAHPFAKEWIQFKLFTFFAFKTAFERDEFDKAAKALLPLKTEQPLAQKPLLSHLTHLLFLIIRIEQNDFDGLEYEIKLAKRYLRKHWVDNPLGQIVLDFAKLCLRKGRLEQPKMTLDKLESLAESHSLEAYENYFEFRLWLRSKVEKRSFAELLRRI